MNTKSVGQWTMMIIILAYLAIAWAVAENVGPMLGYEITIGLCVGLGLFVIHLAQKAGDHLEWRLNARNAKRQ